MFNIDKVVSPWKIFLLYFDSFFFFNYIKEMFPSCVPIGTQESMNAILNQV